MAQQQQQQQQQGSLGALFAELDTDQSGALDRAEIAQLAEKMGAPLTEHELDAAMAEMDSDGSGDVDIDELETWLSARKTSSPLKELLHKRLPTNDTGLERELLRVMKGARDSTLETAKFVPLDDVALEISHRRRRAIIPTVPTGHARALQPAAYAFRSQAQIGKSWSKTIDGDVKARVLEILAPLCKKEPTGCCCAVYDRVISRRYKPEPGVPGLELQLCLCKERTEQAQRASGGGAASNELIQKLFGEIDADQSGTLDREEIKLLALRLGKPMTERQLDEAMAAMDADGGGEIDMDEFAAWFQSAGAASASWASNLLQCAHCAEYGLGFSCGGWTEEGYTAWTQPDEHDEAKQAARGYQVRSLRGYTREGSSRSGNGLEHERDQSTKKRQAKKKSLIGSRYRSPNLRELRHSSPSRYMTETGSWQQRRFVVPDSHHRLEEYAQAAEKRRNASLALQEHTRRVSSLSPGRARREDSAGESGNLSRSSGNSIDGRAVHTSASAPEITPSRGKDASRSNLPPIASRRRPDQQAATVATGDGGASSTRNRTVTPSFGQEASVGGPVRGWASLSPDRSSSESGRYGPGSSSSWFRRTRPNWYGLNSRTQQAF